MSDEINAGSEIREELQQEHAEGLSLEQKDIEQMQDNVDELQETAEDTKDSERYNDEDLDSMSESEACDGMVEVDESTEDLDVLQERNEHTDGENDANKKLGEAEFVESKTESLKDEEDVENSETDEGSEDSEEVEITKLETEKLEDKESTESEAVNLEDREETEDGEIPDRISGSDETKNPKDEEAENFGTYEGIVDSEGNESTNDSGNIEENETGTKKLEDKETIESETESPEDKEETEEGEETDRISDSDEAENPKNEEKKEYNIESLSNQEINTINKEASEIGTPNTWSDFKNDPNNQERYETLQDAKEGYQRVVESESPWNDGEKPEIQDLKPGTRFEMAMSPGQPDDRPGAFGTPNHIEDKEFVRNELAVKEDWKPDVDRVNTYEVIKTLPVNVGKVGPQVDIPADKYLVGGAEQFELLVGPRERMNYIRLVDSRRI